MNLNYLLSSVLVITLSCGQNDTADEKKESASSSAEISSKKINDAIPENAMFLIKAAKIVFKHTGGPEEGTETLYFDDYGAIAVLMVDKKSKYTINHQTMIWKDKKTTIINHDKKTVAKSPFRPKDTEPPSLADTDDQTRKNIGYEKLADETIAGKSCEVWYNAKQNFKYCLWNKIALKEVLGKTINKEATLVEEISEIPASVMIIPSDYK